MEDLSEAIINLMFLDIKYKIWKIINYIFDCYATRVLVNADCKYWTSILTNYMI